jgi:hypothetical protein
MALVRYTAFWQAAGDADASTQYRLDADIAGPGQFSTVVTRAATKNPANSVYSPASAVVAAAVTADATTITLPTGSAAGFPANSLVRWDSELILLGALVSGASDVYSGCVRGVAATIRKAHNAATVMYGVHESHDAGSIELGVRKILRTRAYRIQGADISPPSEGVNLYPRARKDTHHTVIWGLLQDENGVPQNGIEVSLGATATAYIGETGEHILPLPRLYTTDADGYFEFDAVISAAIVGSYSLALTIGGAIAKTLSYIPDRDYVNFEECI